MSKEIRGRGPLGMIFNQAAADKYIERIRELLNLTWVGLAGGVAPATERGMGALPWDNSKVVIPRIQASSSSVSDATQNGASRQTAEALVPRSVSFTLSGRLTNYYRKLQHFKIIESFNIL